MVLQGRRFRPCVVSTSACCCFLLISCNYDLQWAHIATLLHSFDDQIKLVDSSAASTFLVSVSVIINLGHQPKIWPYLWIETNTSLICDHGPCRPKTGTVLDGIRLGPKSECMVQLRLSLHHLQASLVRSLSLSAVLFPKTGSVLPFPNSRSETAAFLTAQLMRFAVLRHSV